MFWSPSSGGVRRYLLAKQRFVQERNDWRQTIVTPVATGPGTSLVPGWPLPGSGGYRVPTDRGACAQILRSLAPDIIEAGDPYRLAWSVLDAAHSLAIPSVAFCHSNLEAMARRIGTPLGAYGRARTAGWGRRYALHLYQRFDLVLAPSEAMRLHLVDAGLRNVERQPLGVDTSQFRPDQRHPQARQELLGSLGLPEGTRLLLYVGRFAPEKNLPVLAEAVRRLGAPYAMLAVGAGPRPPSGERVRVRPYEADRTKLARLIANADAMVHAGDQETFGLAVLESLASGTPVIARAADGLAELVDDSVGAGVDSLRAGDFAEAIRTVCDGDEDARAARAVQARLRAERYDWHVVLRQLFARYQSLLGNKAPRATIEHAANDAAPLTTDITTA